MRHVRSLLASSTALVAIYNLLCQPVMRTQACPPVTTDSSCGEHPHSGRDGSLLTWGMSYRTNSAQECCDRCKLHPKGCNSWTFCGLPICWGLDTGNNHTYGEWYVAAAITLSAVTDLLRGCCARLSWQLVAASQGCAFEHELASARAVHARVATPASKGASGLQAQSAMDVQPNVGAVHVWSPRRPAARCCSATMGHRRCVGSRVDTPAE